MNRTRLTTVGVLASVLLIVGGCGKKKSAERGRTLSMPAAAGDAAPTDALSGASDSLTTIPPHVGAPAWTQETAHYDRRGVRRFASAVGWARIGDPALAREAAEERARGELLRFLHGGPAVGAVEGPLAGARTTDFYAAKDGLVFARVEVETSHGDEPAP
jgi:hypothetical protein